MSITKPRLRVGGYAKLTGEAVQNSPSYEIDSETPYRITDCYASRYYLQLPQCGTECFSHSDLIACDPPALPEVGDYVICDTNEVTPTSYSYTNWKVYRILGIEKDTDPVICRTDHPTRPRQYLHKFTKMPEGYVEPKPEFNVGDYLILPKEMEAEWRCRISSRGINQRMLVTGVVYQPTSKTFVYNLSTDDRSYVIAIGLNPTNWGLTLAPKDWKPRVIPIDLELLKLENVGLTNPGFASCCGAQIIYNFYGTTAGYNFRLSGSDLNGTPLPSIPVTKEHMAAAIKNHCKSRNTGVILSVLATSQIAEYGSMLEECGFIKIKEYPNLNHGEHHMNALYGYFCHEQRQKSAVKEKKRAFS